MGWKNPESDPVRPGRPAFFQLEQRRQAGFDGVEVLIDERWDTRQANYLVHLSERHSLSVISLHNPFVPYIPGWPAAALDRLKLTIALAESLDIKTNVVHLPLRFGFVLVRGFNREALLPTLLPALATLSSRLRFVADISATCQVKR